MIKQNKTIKQLMLSPAIILAWFVCDCYKKHLYVNLKNLSHYHAFIKKALLGDTEAAFLPWGCGWGCPCTSSTPSVSGCWLPWSPCCHGDSRLPLWPWVWSLCPPRVEGCTFWRNKKKGYVLKNSICLTYFRRRIKLDVHNTHQQ